MSEIAGYPVPHVAFADIGGGHLTDNQKTLAAMKASTVARSVKKYATKFGLSEDQAVELGAWVRYDMLTQVDYVPSSLLRNAGA